MDDILAPRFIDPVAARKHLEALRWPDDEPVCPHCGSTDTTRLEGKKHRDGLLQCNDCREQFTVTVGTVFERSKVPLNKWLLCNHLLCAGKKGISAHQIHRMLGVTYKTAWFMCHRLREAMKDDGSPLGGPGKIVESDEAFVGGSKKKRLSRKTAPMKKVVSLVERDGRARSFHVANIHAGTVRGAIVANIDRQSTLMTDDARFYWDIGREFRGGHGTVLHSNKQFSKGGGVHSNTAENFFSILKRGVIGTYHHWSEAHMHRYLAEFDFRYSHKDISDRERADKALIGSFGKRLTYRRTAALAA
jgi:transposase-like protein